MTLIIYAPYCACANQLASYALDTVVGVAPPEREMSELQLTSGCLGRKESVDQALVYRLDEGTAGFGLPVIHQSHPWAGKNVSALRDR